MKGGSVALIWKSWLPAALLAALYFVYPITHTAALRSLLLLALAALVIVQWRRGEWESAPSRRPPPEILALGALTLWLAARTLLGAADLGYSLGEFVREWLGGLLAAWLGYSYARGNVKNDGGASAGRLIAGVALGLFAHALWLLGYQAAVWLSSGRYTLGSTPYGDYAVLSTPINMSFALLFADLAGRIGRAGGLFPWSGKTTQGLLALVAVAIVAVKARNGVITVSVVLLVGMLLLALRAGWRWRSRAGLATAVVLLLVAGLLTANVRSDPRWATFLETVPVALDTQNHDAWLDWDHNPRPRLPSGDQVEESAYLRIAWAKVAVEGIVAHPLGYGYGLGGFGRYLEEKYHRPNAVSSHSGLLDFTLANGLPGLALLLGFCALLFRRGWIGWKNGDPWALALALTLTNYFVRICLDGHLGSHRLNMVMLLCGLLYWRAGRPVADEPRP